MSHMFIYNVNTLSFSLKTIFDAGFEHSISAVRVLRDNIDSVIKM